MRMPYKKLISVLVLLALAMTVQGCGHGGERYRFALVMSHMTNSFTLNLSKGAMNHAAEQGVDLVILDSEYDVAKQIEEVSMAVLQDYDAIIIEPVSARGSAQAVKIAADAGVPIVAVAQRMDAEIEADCFVGADETVAGRIQMEAVAAGLGGRGQIAILKGPSGASAPMDRTEGYYQVLEANPGITIVFEQHANWSSDEGFKVVESWMHSGVAIDAIVANNDGLALGAVRALENAGRLDEVAVYGIDGTPEALESIARGRMAGTVRQGVQEQGELAVEACIKLLEGENVPGAIIVSSVFVDSANVDAYLDADGNRY